MPKGRKGISIFGLNQSKTGKAILAHINELEGKNLSELQELSKKTGQQIFEKAHGKQKPK